MSNDGVWDVIVVGGGPAGLMAAGKAASRGFRVLVLEKNDAVGMKLSITGGGRCNITNLEYDTRTLLAHYGDAAPFLHTPFAQFAVPDTVSFFNERGIAFIEEDRKRAFPQSERAHDVTQCMETYARTNGATIRLKTPVRDVVIRDGVVCGVHTDAGILTARAYVIASGGTSRPETGSTGDAVPWFVRMGHTVAEPNPDLVPLVVKDAWVQHLSGTTLTDVKMTCKNEAGSVTLRGNILCTHFGFSGPLVINAARKVKELLSSGPVFASIDLFPHDDVGTLRAKMHAVFETSSNKTLENALAELVPKSLVDVVLTNFPPSFAGMKTHSVTRDARHALVERIKALPCTITGTKGPDWAIVSDGGVDLHEIDTRTMRSKLHQNVYVVGDMLNVSRPSGGFSLQLCWTTGFVAGNSVCE